jgi:ATP-binding cassette subfamily F protein 3
LSPPIVAIDRVAVGYEPKKPILQRLTLRIDPDDRIALIGSNGNGKSTLVKLIAGRLTPTEGSIVRADRLNVAYFAQHQVDELDPAESAYQHLRRLMPDAAEAKVRTRLGSLGFSADMADQPVATLSGGEKARLLLGLATFSAPHLVILDEPTNHLDIDSRAALVEAINDFPGAVILVSHDRHLLEACADRLWLVANGTVTPYDGDLDDYRRRVLSDRGGGAKSSDGDRKAEARAGQQRAAAPRRAELSPLRKRIKSAETDVARLGAAIAEIDAKLADPLLFSRDPREAARLAKTRSDAAASLAKAEDDWLEASAAYDTASTSAGGQ